MVDQVMLNELCDARSASSREKIDRAQGHRIADRRVRFLANDTIDNRDLLDPLLPCNDVECGTWTTFASIHMIQNLDMTATCSLDHTRFGPEGLASPHRISSFPAFSCSHTTGSIKTGIREERGTIFGDQPMIRACGIHRCLLTASLALISSEVARCARIASTFRLRSGARA